MLPTSLIACSEEQSTGGQNEQQVMPAIKETDEYLVKEGTSDYVVVTPNSPVNWESHAAAEMVDNIKTATGVVLPIIKEASATASQKKIVIGQTALTESVGVSAPIATYGARGFVIKEIDGNVYIVGGDTQGTLYGVYEFLHHQFGYEPYAVDEIYIDAGVMEEKLLAFDISEIPDIAYMQGVHEYYRHNMAVAGHRMRFNTYNEIFIDQDQPWHNVFSVLSPKVYDDPSKPETYHPKWFANDKELHYTAHGDLEELKLMIQTVFEVMKAKIDASFAEGKYYQYIGFMQNDHENVFPTSDTPRTDAKGNPLWTEEPGHVDSVEAIKAKYGDGKGYQAAMLMHFINPLQEMVSNYCMETYGRKVSVMFFSYFDTEAAPVKEINAKYYPLDIITSSDSSNPIFADELYADIYDGDNDGKLRLHPDATVFTAPIRAEFWHEYEDTTATAIVEKWKPLTEKQAFWFYNFYFNSTTFMYYDFVYSMQSYFQVAKDTNCQYLFMESPMTKNNYYPFGNLNVYLFSKLGWDVNANVQQLIDNYFTQYYKGAAKTMRAFFDSVTAYYAYLKNYTGFTGVIGAGGQNLDAKYWPEGILQGWLSYINQAYIDIEPLKYTDKALYDEMYSRILYDSLWPRYLLMRFHAKNAFNDQTFYAELNQFKADCAFLEVKSAGSNVSDITQLDLKRA